MIISKRFAQVSSFAALLLLGACDSLTVQGVLGVKRTMSVNTGSQVAQLPAGQYNVEAKLSGSSLNIKMSNGLTFKVKNLTKTQNGFTAQAGSDGQTFSVTGATETKYESSDGGISSESCVLYTRQVERCGYAQNSTPSFSAETLSNLLIPQAFARGDRGGEDHGGRDRDSGGGRDRDSGGGRGGHDNDRGRDNDRNDRDHGRGDRDRDHDRNDRDHGRGDRDRDHGRNDRDHGRGDRDRDHDRNDRDHGRRDHDRDDRRDYPREPVCHYETENVYGSRTVQITTTTTYAKVRATMTQGAQQLASFNSQWAVKDVSRSSTALSSCH